MAYGAEVTRAGALARFIYVWPSRELMLRSWSWPASWHQAFQDAASRIGLAVAIYGLDGRGFTSRLIELRLSIGSVKFRVKRRGKRIFVTVAEFTAPARRRADRPDRTRQPGAADGLVLGLHGSDTGFYLVVFHGHMPPVPVGTAVARAGASPTARRRGHRRDATAEDVVLSGLRALGGRYGQDIDCELSKALSDGRPKGGSRATIVRSGTVDLGEISADGKRGPTSAGDGAIRLHWALFRCTSKSSEKASPIFCSSYARYALTRRRLATGGLRIDRARGRYLH